MESTNEYYRMLNALSKIYISIYTYDNLCECNIKNDDLTQRCMAL